MGITIPRPIVLKYTSFGTYYRIEPDSAIYEEGSKVTGKLHFDLTKTQSCFEVYLTFAGYEKVLWHGNSNSGYESSLEYMPSPVEGIHEICSTTFMIFKGSDELAPGAYTFPFEFELPTGLPGSYVHNSISRETGITECCCEYTIKSEVYNTIFPMARTYSPIVIIQRQRTMHAIDVPLKINKTIKTLFCIDQGEVDVNCVVDSNIARLNDTLVINASIDLSNCKKSIKALEFTLQRNLALTDGYGKRCMITNSMMSVKTKGCEKETTENDIKVEMDLTKSMDPGFPKNLAGDFGQFARKVQPNCNGTLINCSYDLQVTAQMDGSMLCAKNPTAFTPIEIIPPDNFLAFVADIPGVEAAQSQQCNGINNTQDALPESINNKQESMELATDSRMGLNANSHTSSAKVFPLSTQNNEEDLIHEDI